MSELSKTMPTEVKNNLKTTLHDWFSRWRGQSRDNKFVLMIALLAAVVAAMIVIILWTTSPNFVPLYGKQEMYDAANIMELLEKEKAPFRLDKTSGQILVPENQLAQVRIALAARGVRASMPAGMESLDTKMGLGTSEFMENMRYRNAQEGELARTIIALDAVRSARVHLAIPQRTLFVGRSEEKPTASVMLDLVPGQALEQGQIAAIVNLVAGSITGMKPEAVTVVDQSGRLLSQEMNNDASLSHMSVQQMEYMRRLEDYIRQRAGDMLYPVVGNDNFRIQIAADVDFSKVEETKEALDPNQILRSESAKEDKNSANNTGGVPGSLSNRPPAASSDKNSKDSASKTTTDNSKQTLTERHEYNRQYENSRTVTHTEYPLGRIKQLSVSVLLNQKTAPKTGWNAEQLREIEELVKRATGFDVARGDQFSLASFDFSPTVVTTEPNEELPWWQQSSLQEMLRYGVGSLLGLALIFFGIRPLVKHLVSLQRAESQSETSNKHTEPTLQTTDSRNSRAAVSDDDIAAMLNDVAMQQGARPTLSDNSPLDLDDLPAVGSDFDMQLQHLQLLVDKETARVTDVIKLWINGNERH